MQKERIHTHTCILSIHRAWRMRLPSSSGKRISNGQKLNVALRWDLVELMSTVVKLNKMGLIQD